MLESLFCLSQNCNFLTCNHLEWHLSLGHPLTRDTPPHLVHWHLEGQPPSRLPEHLQAPVHNGCSLLSPLLPSRRTQYQLLEHYLTAPQILMPHDNSITVPYYTNSTKYHILCDGSSTAVSQCQSRYSWGAHPTLRKHFRFLSCSTERVSAQDAQHPISCPTIVAARGSSLSIVCSSSYTSSAGSKQPGRASCPDCSSLSTCICSSCPWGTCSVPTASV